MPNGFSPKREREYKTLVKAFHQSHRYPNHEEEVAARIVNKQRRENGETKTHVEIKDAHAVNEHQ